MISNKDLPALPDDKWEQRARKFDNILPNLSKALRSKDVQESCADIDKYDGWIRCSTSYPQNDELVLVTNGKDIWMGDYNDKRSIRDGKWAVVYDGAPPFDSTEIIAWTFMPYVPDALLNALNS